MQSNQTRSVDAKGEWVAPVITMSISLTSVMTVESLILNISTEEGFFIFIKASSQLYLWTHLLLYVIYGLPGLVPTCVDYFRSIAMFEMYSLVKNGKAAFLN